MDHAGAAVKAVEVTPTARILVVDDSRMVRSSIIRHIKGKYECREEGDGESGWQTLVLDPTVRVVISDLSMPRLDGYGLLARIRNSKISRINELPVIMLSGDEGDEAHARARELGATDFIAKGTGAEELLTRIETALRLAATARELAESREALANGATVDPVSGLSTPQYVRTHGDQLLSAARRHSGDLSVLVVQIDNIPYMVQAHGRPVADLIIRKLSKILSAKIRREDSVAMLGDGLFSILAPGINVDNANAFANRLRAIISGTAMQYRGETLRVSLSIGVANNASDKAESVGAMIGLATQRAARAGESGGDVVVTAGGAPQKGTWSGEPIALERAMVLLQAGEEDEVRPHLHALARRVLPLLGLIEREFGYGIPVERIELDCNQADGAAPPDGP